MRSYFLAVALVLAACGDNGGGPATPDSSPAPDSTSPSCEEVAEQFAAAAETLDDSCDTVADCRRIGGQIDDEGWTCDCAPTLPSFGVNRDAYTGSDAADLSAQFAAECDNADAPAICDAAPPDLSCVNNHCAVNAPSCFDDIDAGV